jgi:hypothetical protein
VTRFVRSKKTIEPVMIRDFRDLGRNMASIDREGRPRHRDIFGRSWT